MLSPYANLTKCFFLSRQAKAVLYGCGLGLVSQSLGAQLPPRFPVKSEQVLLAMGRRDWPVEGVQVRLAAPVTAAVAEPSLEIKAITASHGKEALLRVACRVSSECLPFFASVTWPRESPLPNPMAKRESTAVSFVEGPHGTDGKTPGNSGFLAGNSSAVALSLPTALRAGSSATLLLDGPRVHIRLPVVLAQPAHVGETVRVTTPDRKQVYLAEVLSPELLKGEF